MEAIKYYDVPGMAHIYFDWCKKANGCPSAEEIIRIIKGIDDMRDFSKATMVDLGCGPGTSMVMLMYMLKPEKYILVDASDEMLKGVKNYFGHHKGLTMMKSDLRYDTLGIPDDSVEIAISCSTIPYLESIHHCIQEASRIIKPGGYFGFNGFFHSDINPESRLLYNSHGVKFYHHSLQELERLMGAAGFKEVGSVRIEKSKEEKFLEELFKVEVPENKEFKEEVYNRLMVFEKH